MNIAGTVAHQWPRASDWLTRLDSEPGCHQPAWAGHPGPGPAGPPAGGTGRGASQGPGSRARYFYFEKYCQSPAVNFKL